MKRTKNWIYAFLVIFVLAALPAVSKQSGGSSAPSGKTQPAKNKQANATQQDDGERKFEQNCSRCHNAPESLSPRIAGTVVRHMRVRASLSEQDAQDILHYLRP